MSPQRRALGIAIAAALVVFPAFCQSTSTTTNPSGNTTVPSASPMGGNTGATAPPRSAQQMRLSGRVIALSGIVLRRISPVLPHVPVAITGSVFRQSEDVRRVFYNQLQSAFPGISVLDDVFEPVTGALARARRAAFGRVE